MGYDKNQALKENETTVGQVPDSPDGASGSDAAEDLAKAVINPTGEYDLAADAGDSALDGEAPVEYTNADGENPDGENAGGINAAKVFGVSDDQLQTEFNRFKADKLMKKMISDMCRPTCTQEALIAGIAEAADYKLGGVAVLPNMLSFAVKECAGKVLPLFVAVGCPFGADDFDVKKYLIKKYADKPVNGIICYFDAFTFKTKKTKALVRDYKKLLSCARKKTFFAAVDVSAFTPSETKEVVAALFAAGIKNAYVVCDENADIPQLEAFISAAEGKIEVVASVGATDPQKAVEIFGLGVAYLSLEDAVKTAKEFRKLLRL